MKSKQSTHDQGFWALEAGGSVSEHDPDWTREHKRWLDWNPGRSLLASIRGYQRQAGRRGPHRMLLRWGYVLKHRFWAAVSGADIPLNCRIGGGLLIPHPNGIVIHPACEVGPNCLILQQVTIGSGKGGVPTLGGHVDVGAGAKILGAVHVGHHAVIGANAVVVNDVVSSTTVVGIPARQL